MARTHFTGKTNIRVGAVVGGVTDGVEHNVTGIATADPILGVIVLGMSTDGVVSSAYNAGDWTVTSDAYICGTTGGTVAATSALLVFYQDVDA
jgi:hypothetical protein